MIAQRDGFGVEQCRWPSYGNVALRPFLSCLRTNMDDISVAARRAVCCTYAKYTVWCPKHEKPSHPESFHNRAASNRKGESFGLGSSNSTS
jgi:hypothetical protein